MTAVDGVKNIDDLVRETSKPGEVIMQMSADVALRLCDKAGWAVLEVMTMTKKLKNTEGKEVAGILVEVPMGEAMVNNVITMLQAFRTRRR